MFRTVPLSIVRSFSLYTAMVYVTQVCCDHAVSNTCMYCCVYTEKLLMMDRGTVRNM